MTRSTPFGDRIGYDILGPGSLRSAQTVVPMVMEMLNPASVLDFGSGTGAWLSAFVEAGVSDVHGLEGGSPDPSQLLIPADRIDAVDLEEPVDLGRRFDLAMTVEVAEHLPASAAARFVESIARHADAVLFSAAIPGQGGSFHINEQWPAYWADLFADRGFECFDVLRDRLWTDERVEWWYRQNLLIFARGDAAERMRAYAPAGPPRGLVQPALHERLLVEIRTMQGIRAQAHGLSRAIAARLRAVSSGRSSSR